MEEEVDCPTQPGPQSDSVRPDSAGPLCFAEPHFCVPQEAWRFVRVFFLKVLEISNSLLHRCLLFGPHLEIEDIPVTEIVDMKKYRRYYGTTTSPYAPEAGEALVRTAIDVLKTL